MATHSSVSIEFGDGDYVFDLGPIGQRLEIESKCGTGLMGVLRRLDEARVNDYREPIRLGLIGGGMKPEAALAIVKNYVDARPVMESIPVARAILMAVLIGIPDDTVGKTEAEGTTREADGSTKPDALSVPQSTVQEPQSDSRRGRSTRSRSGNSPRALKDGTPRTGQNPQ